MVDGTIEPFAVDVPLPVALPMSENCLPCNNAAGNVSDGNKGAVQALAALDAPQEEAWIDQWAAEALPV